MGEKVLALERRRHILGEESSELMNWELFVEPLRLFIEFVIRI